MKAIPAWDDNALFFLADELRDLLASVEGATKGTRTSKYKEQIARRLELARFHLTHAENHIREAGGLRQYELR